MEKQRSSAQPSTKTTYLRLYNIVSAILWFTILGRVLLLIPLVGVKHVFGGTGNYTRWVQTGASLEVVHSAVGLVRAPIVTTLMQVASRFLLVWGIGYNFPRSTAESPAYATMLIAWSVTEVIRYGYFAVSLGGGKVPGWLVWLRYNTFYVLYPTGILSETWLVYKAIAPATKMNELYGVALKAILMIYVPGSYILYTHMMAQRRKVMKGKGKAQ